MTSPSSDPRCPTCSSIPIQDLTDRGVHYPFHYDHRWRCDLHCCVAEVGLGTTPGAAADFTRRRWAARWAAPPAQEPA
jgi:hypothetical protein